MQTVYFTLFIIISIGALWEIKRLSDMNDTQSADIIRLHDELNMLRKLHQIGENKEVKNNVYSKYHIEEMENGDFNVIKNTFLTGSYNPYKFKLKTFSNLQKAKSFLTNLVNGENLKKIFKLNDLEIESEEKPE